MSEAFTNSVEILGVADGKLSGTALKLTFDPQRPFITVKIGGTEVTVRGAQLNFAVQTLLAGRDKSKFSKD
jgi:hypothetical protein